MAILGADHPAVAAHANAGQMAVSWRPGDSVPDQLKAATVVLPGLLTVLPDPVLVLLLKDLRAQLPDDGVCIASGLRPSADAVFCDLVLGWPTVRRSPAQLMSMLMLAGYQVKQDVPCVEPGLVVVAAPAPGGHGG